MRLAVNALVRKVLENPDRFDWQIQGLGMLRTYLSREVRLHIWHSALKVPNASTLHTHPWDFRSDIVVGTLWNTKYYRSRTGKKTHHRSILRCGVGGGLVTDSIESVSLGFLSEEVYLPGTHYTQQAHEIHETMARDGTLTLVERTFLEDVDHADVFWKHGTEWGSAEPRQATLDEIRKGVESTLMLLDIPSREE